MLFNVVFGLRQVNNTVVSNNIFWRPRACGVASDAANDLPVRNCTVVNNLITPAAVRALLGRSSAFAWCSP